jgi:hypothetical protein
MVSQREKEKHEVEMNTREEVVRKTTSLFGWVFNHGMKILWAS